MREIKMLYERAATRNFHAGFLFYALTAFFHITPSFGEEPLPPNCNEFLGRQCDRDLQTCLFANASSNEAQCRCYELSVACLERIDPTECLRGAHCTLFYNSCTQFYCKENPIRCRKCYSSSEIDIPRKESSLLLQFATSPPGAISIILLLFVSGYHCYFFGKRVLLEGASCEASTCPNYDRYMLALNGCRRICRRQCSDAGRGRNDRSARHQAGSKNIKKRKKKKKKQKKRNRNLTHDSQKARPEFDVLKENNDFELADQNDGGGGFAASELDQLQMLEEYRDKLGQEIEAQDNMLLDAAGSTENSGGKDSEPLI